jgi:hypothetical protein
MVMKYNLLSDLNESIAKRTPVITAGVSSEDDPKRLTVLDVQHLDSKHVVEQCRRIIAQAMSRWNPKEKPQFQFQDKADGILTLLGITVTAPDKKTRMEIAISPISDSDVEQIKKLYS